MIAHFFDIDTLITVDNNVWIVSKSKPGTPIIKISKSEFNLIKKGIYKKYNSKLNINGINYWLTENLFNNLKIKCNRYNHDITNLAFSMQEFIDQEIIENLKHEIHYDHFKHLKNKTEDIYIICSKRSKKSYKPIIEKLEKKMSEIGLSIIKYYYLSETFYNKNDDNISYKKSKLLLQHLLGLKTEQNKFTETKLKEYNKIFYYGDDIKSLTSIQRSDKLFSVILDQSSDLIKDTLKEKIRNNEKVIITKKVTYNDVNLFEDEKVVINYSYIKKTFENFNYLNI